MPPSFQATIDTDAVHDALQPIYRHGGLDDLNNIELGKLVDQLLTASMMAKTILSARQDRAARLDRVRMKQG